MKKAHFLSLILLATISFVSCSTSDSDKLIGTWKITSAMSNESYVQGDKAADIYKQTDEMLKAAYTGVSLEFKEDKTGTMKKEGEATFEFTWKMDEATGKILELYNKEGKMELFFRPNVQGAESLFYMEGIDSAIAAEMIFSQSNEGCVVNLSK